MEYKITFQLPDELDPLIDLSEQRKKYLLGKVSEFIQELLGQECLNAVEHGLNPHKLEPEIRRYPRPQDCEY